MKDVFNPFLSGVGGSWLRSFPECTEFCSGLMWGRGGGEGAEGGECECRSRWEKSPSAPFSTSSCLSVEQSWGGTSPPGIGWGSGRGSRGSSYWLGAFICDFIWGSVHAAISAGGTGHLGQEGSGWPGFLEDQLYLI